MQIILALLAFSHVPERSTTLDLSQGWSLECRYDDGFYLVTKNDGEVQGSNAVDVKDIPSKGQRRRCFNAFIRSQT